MDDCVFCKIVKREIPAEIVAETENVIAFKSNKPAASTHILIVPKKHITSFMEIEQSDKDLIAEMTSLTQKVIKEKDIADGFKIAINGGRYPEVKHIHWHLLAGGLEDSNDVLSKT